MGAAMIACILEYNLKVPGQETIHGWQKVISDAHHTRCRVTGGLVSVPLAHDRSGHAEFVALSELLTRICAFSCGNDFSDVTGEVLLYVTRHPCLSCIGAISQFN